MLKICLTLEATSWCCSWCGRASFCSHWAMGVCNQYCAWLPLVALPKRWGVADKHLSSLSCEPRHPHLWTRSKLRAARVFSMLHTSPVPVCLPLKKEFCFWEQDTSVHSFEKFSMTLHFLVCHLQKPVSCKSCCCSFQNGKVCVDFGCELQCTGSFIGRGLERRCRKYQKLIYLQKVEFLKARYSQTYNFHGKWFEKYSSNKSIFKTHLFYLHQKYS